MSTFRSKPDDEHDVDREIRIEKMKRELDDIAGGTMISGSFGEVPPEFEEIFLARVCELENATYDTNFNRLIQRGIELLPPAELDDASVRVKLQQVENALAESRCFLEQTDHLSDRELYSILWTDMLREETPDLAEIGGAWHMSPIGSGTEEDMTTFLKYYASEEERRQWQKELPNDTLPPHSPLPYDRDRNLPRP